MDNKDDRNLVAKMNNTVADLNFYCYRFLVRDGYFSTPRTGVNDAHGLIQIGKGPKEIRHIVERYDHIIARSNPKNANDLFYYTWTFLHEFDKLFQNGI